MDHKKHKISDVLAWLGPIHGLGVLICFLSGFIFSSMEAYEAIWMAGQILTFGFTEPEFIPYPAPTWLAIWLTCLASNRFMVGRFRFLPWKTYK